MPPADSTFSGSCKDVQHINKDIHHADDMEHLCQALGFAVLGWEQRPAADSHIQSFSTQYRPGAGGIEVLRE